jgi:hypothetical protein
VEVAKAARVEGAGATARALRPDRARLEARMAPDRGTEVAETSRGFVELDAGRLELSARTIVRFHGRASAINVLAINALAIDAVTLRAPRQ